MEKGMQGLSARIGTLLDVLIGIADYNKCYYLSMATDCFFREGRFQKKDGDVEFDFVTIDGIGLCPWNVVSQPGGYPKRLNEIINLECQAQDVILATYPKCGTHWTSEILNMILQGKANYVKYSKLSAMLEALPNLDMLERVQSPRVLNTHLPYKWLPKKHIRNGGKIINMTRNPKDAYVSLFHHCKGTLELGHQTKNMTWAQFFDTCVLGKDIIYGSWFDYAKEMDLAKKRNENIYTVYYESMKEFILEVLDKTVHFQLPSEIIEKTLYFYLLSEVMDKTVYVQFIIRNRE